MKRIIMLLTIILMGGHFVKSEAQIIDAVSAVGDIIGIAKPKTVTDKGANSKLSKLRLEAMKQSKNMQEVLNLYTKVNQSLQELYVIKQVAQNHIDIQRELLSLIDMLSHSEMKQTREQILTQIEQIKTESEQTMRSVKTIMSPKVKMTAGERMNILYAVKSDQEKTKKKLEQNTRAAYGKENLYSLVNNILK